MRCLTILAFWMLAAMPATHAGDTNAVNFYLQLVRGTDNDRPPAAGARRLGPKLSGSLHSVFKWAHYWEINQQAIAVAPGARKQVVLSKERSVEIDLRQANKQRTTAFSNNKSVSSITQPASETMTIIGADRDTKSAWFVVVRRDKPSID